MSRGNIGAATERDQNLLGKSAPRSRFTDELDRDIAAMSGFGEAEAPFVSDTDLTRALDAARARGNRKIAEILNGEDMLGADAFASLLGVSRMTVNVWRTRRKLLALHGAKRGYRFPVWQIDLEGQPFAILPRLFEIFQDSPWSVYRFLVQHHAELDGATARYALLRGQTREVLDAAEGLAAGTFA